MDKNLARFSFAGVDDIEAAVAIEVGENGVFRVRGASDRDFGPRLAHAGESGVNVDARRAVLLPRGGDVGQTVTVDVGEFRAVGARTFVVDHVQAPRRSRRSRRGGPREEQRQEKE